MNSVAVAFLALAHVLAIASGDQPSSRDALSDEQQSLVCYLKQELEEGFSQLKIFNALRAAQDMASKTCAVVSSSGALLNHTYGEEISAHDIILRFNSATTVHYEKYVGNRTDIRVQWTSTPFQNGPAVYDISEAEWHMFWPSVAVLHHLYPTNLGQVKNKLDPTTGFYGMLLALANCKRVDSYEMYPSKNNSGANYHYFGKPPSRVQLSSWRANSSIDHSDFAAEHDLWARLSLTSHDEVSRSGKTEMIGFKDVVCPSQPLDPGPLENTPAPVLPCPSSRVNLTLTFTGLEKPLSNNMVDRLQLMLAYKLSANLGRTDFQCVDLKRVGLGSDGVQKVVGTVALPHPWAITQLENSEFTEYVCGQVAPKAAKCHVRFDVDKASHPAIHASLRAAQDLAESVSMHLSAGAAESGLPWWSWAALGCSTVIAVVFCFVPLCAAPDRQAGLDEEERSVD
mmetsp:Transcript_9346/g.21600  ORF Transcript_9346/g.21600 Transcript_9346/m.21600 type:complete len:455 (+) Transcript_9346:43-1407(+)